MTDPDKIVLQVTPMRWFSRYDEAAFFEWLDKLKCVSEYKGEYKTLYIYVDRSAVDNNELYELRGLFSRYEVDKKQLDVFKR